MHHRNFFPNPKCHSTAGTDFIVALSGNTIKTATTLA